MTTYKFWTKLVVWTILILTGTIVLTNVIVDAYGILRTDFSRQAQVPNMNYIKMEYLLSHPDRFDSFILGSSRAEKIDVSHLTNGRYYALTYPLGVPQEHLENIKALLRHGVRIRNILVGLDDFSSRVDVRERINNLDLQPHPAVSRKNWEAFYGEYFFKLRQLQTQVKAYIRHNYTHKSDREETRYIYDMFGSGRILCPSCDEEIEKNTKAYVASPGFKKPLIKVYGDNRAETVSVMQELVDLARTNNIHLTVFINPVHRTTYLDADLSQFAWFKKKLADITEYYDFSGLNSITTNNYYYYETSHYRTMVGDMMLKVMFGRPDVAVPRDFGVLVTSANIDSHLADQCQELRSVRQELTGANLDFVNSCALPSSQSAQAEIK